MGINHPFRVAMGRCVDYMLERMKQEIDAMGPISYLVVEFPGNRMTGEAFPILLDLVDKGLIRILDLVFVRKDEDGSVRAMELADIDHDGQFDLVVFEGASSGLLDETDVHQAGSAVGLGTSAAILLFENRWARSFVGELRKGGAELVAAGYVPLVDIEASIRQSEQVAS